MEALLRTMGPMAAFAAARVHARPPQRPPGAAPSRPPCWPETPGDYDSTHTSAIVGSSLSRSPGTPAGAAAARRVLQVSFQRVIADAEHARGLASPAPAAFDHEPRIARRPGAHRLVPLERRHQRCREVSPERLGQILELDHVGRRQRDGAFDEPLELADVAGPVVGDAARRRPRPTGASAASPCGVRGNTARARGCRRAARAASARGCRRPTGGRTDRRGTACRSTRPARPRLVAATIRTSTRCAP